MKKIEAVIRVEKLEEITEELKKFGCPGMMVTHIEGHGRQKGISEQFRGREYKVEFIPKIKIEIVVMDADIDKIVKCIRKTAYTGEIGDGKVFIIPVDDALRIRTGDKGDPAL